MAASSNHLCVFSSYCSSSSFDLASSSTSLSSNLCDDFLFSPARDDQSLPLFAGEVVLDLRLIDELWFRDNVLSWQLRRQPVQAVDQPDSGICLQLIHSNSGDAASENLGPEPEKEMERVGVFEARMMNESVGVVDEVVEAVRSLNLDREDSSILHQEKQLVNAKDKEKEVVAESGFSSQKIIQDCKRPLRSIKPQLETIASGKQLATEGMLHLPVIGRRRLEPRERAKSLSDIEYDEVKGFRELGFNFSEDELTPRMVRLVPGLRPLSTLSLDSQFEASSVQQVYPPEDWWEGKTEPGSQPRSPKWQIPSPQEGVDMKEQLKFWARAVASTVRQEC